MLQVDSVAPSMIKPFFLQTNNGSPVLVLAVSNCDAAGRQTLTVPDGEIVAVGEGNTVIVTMLEYAITIPEVQVTFSQKKVVVDTVSVVNCAGLFCMLMGVPPDGYASDTVEDIHWYVLPAPSEYPAFSISGKPESQN